MIDVAVGGRAVFCRGVSSVKHLLIDGSNLLHAWPELKALEKRDADTARRKLSDTVRVIHDFEGVQVTVVFDGRGEEAVMEQPSGHPTFVHIFTPSHLTADDVIEHFVGQISEPGTCWVATDDRAERQTVEALGAVSISTKELAAWVARTESRQQAKVSGLNRAAEKEWRRHEGGHGSGGGR
ncbi:MAG TPA: NYN domain-containing protein [Opitutaceae bacterium]|nr:NYN domain-containing protein [Opitutaceae bacterium]